MIRDGHREVTLLQEEGHLAHLEPLALAGETRGPRPIPAVGHSERALCVAHPVPRPHRGNRVRSEPQKDRSSTAHPSRFTRIRLPLALRLHPSTVAHIADHDVTGLITGVT